WYRLDENGEVQYDDPITADESALPVDPSSDPAPGFDNSRRGVPGGFVGDPDVMDTWATSSLTPQIASGWGEDEELFAKTFPMDLRPQGHDIIRTWLFSTVLRSQLEHGTLPWANAAITGFIYDPERKKMSKSKGNAVTPMGLLEEYGADGFRYWATSVRPGMDAAFDVGQMKVGRRLAIKVLNVSKFVLSRLGEDGSGAATADHPLDRSLLAGLAEVASAATAAFEAYDFARALERTESFFWSFCDDYVELVKARAYGSAADPGTASARATLSLTLSVLLRLLAPFLPYVTEEVWSWWQQGSIHRADWPDAAELAAAAGDGDPAVLGTAAAVLARVRKAKTEAARSLRAPVDRVTVTAGEQQLDRLRQAGDDLRQAGSVAVLDLVGGGGDEVAVEVELAAEAS
ncbi:MAG TPA: class I tRNA ligase family protein, partial [Acidimicrobiales bacterium]|nr:class I tRNA ligase family protein [Acidimicrobiales bacterium]